MNNKTIGNIFKGDKVIWMIFFPMKQSVPVR